MCQTLGMNRCPAHGCKKRIQDGYAFCKTHWYMIPKAIRDEMWLAHNTKNREKSLELMMQAIRNIKKKEDETEAGMSYAS